MNSKESAKKRSNLKLPFKETPLKLIKTLLAVSALLIIGGLLYIFVLTNYFHTINYGNGTLYYNFNKSGECSLEIDGQINAALEDAFNDILKKSERYDCKSYGVSLNSSGGNLAITLRLGDIIRSKNMTTTVLDKCKSSCMYLFISGKIRIASKYSILGMHQSKNTKSGECSTPANIPKDKPNFFRGLRDYAVKRLGQKAGEFFTAKDNLAGCNEMLLIDNEEFQREGIISTLTDN